MIASMDSVPVRTMADLRGRLYVLPPSTPVTLSVRTGSTSADNIHATTAISFRPVYCV